MKNLLILRHAKSSWANMYMSDFERPLNPRGQGDAPRMGQLLKDEKLGVVARSGDPAGFARQLEGLLQDRERHTQMKNNAARVFSERFDAATIFPELTQNLRALATSPSG